MPRAVGRQAHGPNVLRGLLPVDRLPAEHCSWAVMPSQRLKRFRTLFIFLRTPSCAPMSTAPGKNPFLPLAVQQRGELQLRVHQRHGGVVAGDHWLVHVIQQLAREHHRVGARLGLFLQELS